LPKKLSLSTTGQRRRWSLHQQETISHILLQTSRLFQAPLPAYCLLLLASLLLLMVLLMLAISSCVAVSAADAVVALAQLLVYM
jgi:hypothetical protein